jgi:hypothetical protein
MNNSFELEKETFKQSSVFGGDSFLNYTINEKINNNHSHEALFFIQTNDVSFNSTSNYLYPPPDSFLSTNADFIRF